MGADDVERFRRRDVLDDDLEALVVAQQRQQALLHEHGLTIEDVDGGIGRLAVNQDRHADPFHPLQHRTQRLDVGDAVMGVGGGAGRIEFGGGPYLFGMALLDFVG